MMDICQFLSVFGGMKFYINTLHPDRLSRESPAQAGAILTHMRNVIARVMQDFGGEGLCIFKIGITAQPLLRWEAYRSANYLKCTILHVTNCIWEACWGEAALIACLEVLPGCRNIQKGGDGPLHVRGDGPPYFIYIVTARADGRWVY